MERMSEPKHPVLTGLYLDAVRARAADELYATGTRSAARLSHVRGLVLSIGCGLGHTEYVLATRSPSVRVLGIDEYAPAIEAARSHHERANLEFQLASLETFDGGPYDGILADLVLHEFPDLTDALRRIHARLKPGGTFAFSDLDRADAPQQATLRDYIERRNQVGDEAFVQRMVRLVEKADGLDVADAGLRTLPAILSWIASYTHQEVRQGLRRAGFGHIEMTRSDGMYHGTARRPA